MLCSRVVNWSHLFLYRIDEVAQISLIRLAILYQGVHQCQFWIEPRQPITHLLPIEEDKDEDAQNDFHDEQREETDVELSGREREKSGELERARRGEMKGH